MSEETQQNDVSIIQYNDENFLSSIMSLTYFSAKNDYEVYREMPGGEGYAALVFVQRIGRLEPAIIVGLK